MERNSAAKEGSKEGRKERVAIGIGRHREYGDATPLAICQWLACSCMIGRHLRLGEKKDAITNKGKDWWEREWGMTVGDRALSLPPNGNI